LNKNNVLLLSFIFIVAIGSFTYRNTHGIESKIALLVNIIIFFVFAVVSYLYFKQIHKIGVIKQEYNLLLSYIERYENELDKKRKIVHEFNNQLIVINSYASKNNKKLKNYLYEIINDQKSICNDMLLNNIENLPKGFRGLLYYKLSKIENDLKITLFVEKGIKSFSLASSKTAKNILKIIGILIDNAIEASIDSKEKTLDIIVTENKQELEIKISNSIKKNIDAKKIFNKGFTTKGNGRGYGLLIVKDMLDEEPNIKLDFKVDNNFVSILKIKK
jgi:two-component system sensor histidine kinase AgrC